MKHLKRLAIGLLFLAFVTGASWLLFQFIMWFTLWLYAPLVMKVTIGTVVAYWLGLAILDVWPILRGRK